MKALKFYDKEGNGFELYADHERQSIIMEIESDKDEPQFVEFDDDDIDDIILAFVNLKNELVGERNVSNN